MLNRAITKGKYHILHHTTHEDLLVVQNPSYTLGIPQDLFKLSTIYFPLFSLLDPIHFRTTTTRTPRPISESGTTLRCRLSRGKGTTSRMSFLPWWSASMSQHVMTAM